MDKKTLELLAAEGKQADKAEERQAAFKEEATQIMLEQQRYDIEKLKEEVEGIKQDIAYRKHLTRWVMCIVPTWLIGVLLAVFLCASNVWELSDIAMSALLTTTTANILGLAYIVLKGMFPQKSEKE